MSRIVIVSLGTIFVAVTGCDDVEPLSSVIEPGETPFVVEYRRPPERVDAVDDYSLTFDVIADVPGAEGWPLGFCRLEHGVGGWRTDYELFTGDGRLDAVVSRSGLFVLADDSNAGFRSYHTRYRLPTDGPNVAHLAAMVSRWELSPGGRFRLPARDLRQGLDYDLELIVVGSEELTTTWERLTALRVFVRPQKLTLWLDEEGFLVMLDCPEFHAVRRPPEEDGPNLIPPETP